mgnify:CR=1 FL=1
MEEYLMNDGVFLFQLICAGLCGMAVGIERQSRMKSAGVRTHFVVAMASALMMIVSKYGFLDVISINGARVDVSRVAAGIISGIGILGGGLIFIGKQGLVSGMTTAAGIWMTVGIGMAMGARMYVLGFEGTILILLMQYLFHRKFTIFKEPLRAQTIFMVDDEGENVDTIIKRLEAMGIEVSRIKIEKKDENNFQLKCDIILPRKMERDDFTSRIEEISNLISYEV